MLGLRRKRQITAMPGVAEVAGRAAAVGLDWYLPSDASKGRIARARYARELGYDRAAIRGGEYAQPGFGSSRSGHRPGLPAAAVAAAAATPAGARTWQGLLPLADGRLLHVVVANGLVSPAGGDVVRASGQDAVAGFEALRADQSWDALYAPADLALPGTSPFPEDRLAETIRKAPRLQDTALVPKPYLYAGAIAALVGALAILVPLAIEQLSRPEPEPQAEEALPPASPPGVDSEAFLRGCSNARLRAEIPLPGWKRVETACGDGISSRGLVASGEGTLLVQWTHNRPRVAHLRRIAERRLGRMEGALGVVDEREAFGAAVVEGYSIPELRSGKSLSDIRRLVDERLGPIAATLSLIRAPEPAGLPPNIIPFDEWLIELTTPHSVDALLERTVPHLEWLRVRWPEGGDLRAEGRIRIAAPDRAVSLEGVE